MLRTFTSLSLIASLGFMGSATALDGGTLRIDPRNGWDAFELVSIGDDVAGDGNAYALPGTFDGLGAQVFGSSLRIQLNHERSDASISEILVDLGQFQSAIGNVITNGGGNTGGVSFVTSAKQAYNRWSDDGGASWIATTGTSNTSFSRFCSGQSYSPNTFGIGRGFVDDIFITGEELTGGRLMALDLDSSSLYQLSGVAGDNGAGLAGMPNDAWENAALLDTGETNHVAMILSPDGGSGILQLYVGEKGKDANGAVSNDFLARNGLAYGSYYFLNESLPGTEGTTNSNGFFDTTTTDALSASKMEDVDTSPTSPTQMVLGNQNFGTFTFDFDLDFSSGSFDAGASSFDLTMIADDVSSDTDLNNADNVDWTAATTLNGTTYADGLIFVNEDESKGQVWMMLPDGSGRVLIADTDNVFAATETSGILDISELVGYNPGSILLTTNQGGDDSLSVLINPDATPVPEPTSLVVLGLGSLLLVRRRRG